MNKIRRFLKSDGGYVFVILLVVILGLGTLGMALAAGTVSNLMAHKSFARLDRDYYGSDGSMSHVQAILERACAYARFYAKQAAEELYEEYKDTDNPKSSDELDKKYEDTYKSYLLFGGGKTYINEQLDNMESNPSYNAKADPEWDKVTNKNDALQLRVNIKLTSRNEKLSALFNLPYHYVPAENLPKSETSTPVPGSMPIGFYNALFRAPLTMNAKIHFNSNANLRLDSAISGIAAQWLNGYNNKVMLSSDSRVDMNGTTIPILEEDNSSSLYLNGQKPFYVNGVKVSRSTPCEASKRINLSKYYDSSYMAQISNSVGKSFFEAAEGDCVLRIYNGDAKIESDTDKKYWSELNGKKGLIVIAGNLTINSSCDLTYFLGSILVLGSNDSRADSKITITHDEEAVKQAIYLYRKATGKDTVEKMFKLDTLLNATEDPEVAAVKTLGGSDLFKSPLTIGNSYVTSSGLNYNGSDSYFNIMNIGLYIKDPNNAAIKLQSAKPSVQFVSNGSFYINNTRIWDSAGNKTSDSVVDLYKMVNAEQLKAWKNSNLKGLARQSSSDSDTILKIYTGDALIRNSGSEILYVNDNYYELINGKSGLIFINGKLKIDSPFTFNGVIIATNGVEVTNNNVTINYNLTKALDAINLATPAVELFSPEGSGAVVTSKTKSVYDNTIQDLSLFEAALTISNEKFQAPFTGSIRNGITSNIDLYNCIARIKKGNGKGLQAATDSIYTYLHNHKEEFYSDAFNTIDTGTFPTLNKIESIESKINLSELAKWLSGTEGAITKTSGEYVLGMYSEGHSYDLDNFNGKKGFLFFNFDDQIEIKHDFDFKGVIIASRGVKFKNNNTKNNYMSIELDQQAALRAVAQSPTATKIFFKAYGPSSGSTDTTKNGGAKDSGSVNFTDPGVTILSWNSIK